VQLLQFDSKYETCHWEVCGVNEKSGNTLPISASFILFYSLIKMLIFFSVPKELNEISAARAWEV
jgi:hypothetical protein